ncbi:hypothetical protein Pla22_16610 [Rubripirellula amarantea]|uniref:Uncharacterized protein n=1 Tax=Rubripirellula amarantea TaxID=2527999 RepID=A0A5C5WTM3_9BACT|nr:hypothetical protein Pla22_16610 [Rubripirellula amarantea]
MKELERVAVAPSHMLTAVKVSAGEKLHLVFFATMTISLSYRWFSRMTS